MRIINDDYIQIKCIWILKLHTHTQSMQIKIKIELVLKRIIFYGIFFLILFHSKVFFLDLKRKKNFFSFFYCQVFEEFLFQIFHWMLQRISNWCVCVSWRKEKLLFHTWKIHFIRGAFKRLSKGKNLFRISSHKIWIRKKFFFH